MTTETRGASEPSNPRDLTFGVNVGRDPSFPRLRDAATFAEEAGFDVVTMADHLGAPAPFSMLSAVAAVTHRVRLRTYVLDAYFWNGALLAREVATLDALSGGRFELGIGAGHMKHEHDDAGVPFPPHAERVRHTEELLLDVRRRLADDHVPPPVQRPVPIAVGGWGARLLTIAARHAQIVGLGGALQVPGRRAGTLRLVSDAETVERLELLSRLVAEERSPQAPAPVLDALLQRVVVDRPPEQAAQQLAQEFSGPDDEVAAEDLLDSPFVLFGATPEDAAAELLRRRDRFGITSWCTHSPSAEQLAAVIRTVRG